MPTVDVNEQVFPAVQRVLYGKAPLFEVVCQVRFPADLRLETEPPAMFQQRVRHLFPILKQQTKSVLSGLPEGVAKALEVVAPPTGTTTTWQFSTEDGKVRLELVRDNLTQVSLAYHRWEDFFEPYRESIDALVELYDPKFFTRIGLRFRDLIKRSNLGLEDTPWSELLKPHVLGELAVEDVGDRAIEASRNLLLSLPEKGAKVRLQHGFSDIADSNEQGYLIDCDFFVERTEINHGPEAIQYLHEHAGRYFQWCITPRLHQAMEPTPMV